MSRTQRLTFRCSPEELRQVEQAAQTEQRSVSDFARLAVLRRAVEVPTIGQTKEPQAGSGFATSDETAKPEAELVPSGKCPKCARFGSHVKGCPNEEKL